MCACIWKQADLRSCFLKYSTFYLFACFWIFSSLFSSPPFFFSSFLISSYYFLFFLRQGLSFFICNLQIWLGRLVSESPGSANLYFSSIGITSTGHHGWLSIWVLRLELRLSCRTDSYFLCPESVSFLFLKTREGRSRKDAQMRCSSPRELSLWHVSHPISRGWQYGRVGKE